jgi:hypothetical protein
MLSKQKFPFPSHPPWNKPPWPRSLDAGRRWVLVTPTRTHSSNGQQRFLSYHLSAHPSDAGLIGVPHPAPGFSTPTHPHQSPSEHPVK